MPQQNSPAEPLASRRNNPKAPGGFVLLHTLVLVIIASILLSAMMTFALDESLEASAASISLRLDTAAESGAHYAIHDALNNRMAIGTGIRSTKIDGVNVTYRVQASDGLLSLRAGDHRHLHVLLNATLGAQAQTAFASLSNAPHLGSYSDLVPLPGLGWESLGCLLPYVTLFSDLQEPSQRAPEPLRSMLNLRTGNTASVMHDGTDTPAGSIIRVQTQASDGPHKSRQLLMEILVTGRTDSPLWILEWIWVPDTGTANCLKGN